MTASGTSSVGATTLATKARRSVTMRLASRITSVAVRAISSWARAWRAKTIVVAVEETSPPKKPITAAPCSLPIRRSAA